MGKADCKVYNIIVDLLGQKYIHNRQITLDGIVINKNVLIYYQIL